MRFTVIIPLYNKRAFVVQAVQSVLAQEYIDFELLVVDDGSTDGSAELIEEQVNDPRLRIIRQDNLGGSGGQARNTGMTDAQGEWFAFLDADDMWLSNHLTELAAIAEHVGQPALISTTPQELSEGTVVKPDLRAKSTIHSGNYFVSAGGQIGLNNTSSTAIHRDIFERIGGFINVRSGEDLEYWARAALQFPYVSSNRETSVYYRGTMGTMEQLEVQSKGKQQPVPVKLQDVSPSLAMLCEKAANDPALFERDDIRFYVNGRLRAGMRINIRQSNPQNARLLRRFMIGSVMDHQTRVLSVAARLPRSVLRVLNAGYDLYVGKRRRR
jgi:glycosyltransferase involved in cell wall biosynthesis